MKLNLQWVKQEQRKVNIDINYIAVNPDYVKFKIKKETKNIKEKIKYKRNVNKAKNKGKKKENAYALDHI